MESIDVRSFPDCGREPLVAPLLEFFEGDKGFYPPLGGNCTSRRPARLFHREGLANGTCLRGQEAPTAGRQSDGGRTRRI